MAMLFSLPPIGYLIIVYVRPSQKPYKKSENMIWWKRNLKGFAWKILSFGSPRKYVDSIASNILTQIGVSSDDSTSHYLRFARSLGALVRWKSGVYRYHSSRLQQGYYKE